MAPELADAVAGHRRSMSEGAGGYASDVSPPPTTPGADARSATLAVTGGALALTIAGRMGGTPVYSPGRRVLELREQPAPRAVRPGPQAEAS